MKLFVSILAVITILFSLATPSFAQDRRYATCDVCGYCVVGQDPANWATVTPPGDWEQCRKCLYPSANSDPTSGDTLLIDDLANAPPTPMAGRHFTVFGCIKTQLSDFSQTGAASSFVQVLLNVIFVTSGGIALLYIFYGSFLIMTSQADPERLAYGKRVVMGAIVGLILSLSSVFVVNLVASGVLRLPGFGSKPTS